MNDIIITAENISYKVKDSRPNSEYTEIEILKDVSFTVSRGNILGITGESGSGKSTLAKVIAGIFKPSSGIIKFNFNKDWSNSFSKPIQILFQNDGELINPYRKVRDLLNEVFEIKFQKKDDYTQNILSSFNVFELNPELLERKGHQLSGGEQQRIALARIINIEPEILILDEPFASQDVESQLNILKLIKKIKDNFNVTMIVISHDLSILNKLCDNLLIMREGKIVESGLTQNIFTSPQNDYTKFLLSAQALQLSKAEIESQV
jgi:ABC-type dipeptide/oligopeptide/nickel transport system ATPase subunit